MKRIYTLAMIVVLGVAVTRCDKAVPLKTTCDSKVGTAVTDQVGKIYKNTKAQPAFYYIGSPAQASTGVNGGYVPCGGLPVEFRSEGMLVQFSGLDKGSVPDTGDPLFAFITLSKIEKAK